MRCYNCGMELTGKFCSNCGATSAPPTAGNNTYANQNPRKKSKKSNLPVIFMAVAGIALAIIVGVSVRIIDSKTLATGETKLDSVETQIESQGEKIEQVKDIYDVSLASGTYIVGKDLAPGIYHFTYTLKNPDRAWGDYIYVTYADSEGTQENVRGIKFDYSTLACEDGVQVSIKLDAGSTVFVEANHGNWNPGIK